MPLSHFQQGKYIGVGAILDTVRPDGSISLEYFIMTNELLGLNL